MFKGRMLLPGQHRPGLEAAPPLASWLPGHRQALPGSRGGHPRASPAPPSPHTAPPRGQAGHPAPLRRVSSCSVCTSRLLPGRQEAAGARAVRPAHLVQGAFRYETPVSLLLPLLTRGLRGATRVPRPASVQAGRLTVQPLLPESGRGRGVSACLATPLPRGRCDVGARAEPQHGYDVETPCAHE